MLPVGVLWDLGLIIATALVARAYRLVLIPLMFRWRARRLFPFDRGTDVAIVIPTVPNEEFAQMEMIDQTTPLESVYVTRYLANYLKQLIGEDGDLAIELSDMCLAETMRGNVVLVGGPVHNRCSANFLKANDTPLRFDGHVLVSGLTQARYEALIEDGKIVKDYTIVSSMKNPWNPERDLVFIAACRGYGAISAARFLVEGGIKKIVERAGGGRGTGQEIHAVLSCHVDHLPGGHFNAFGDSIEEASLRG